MVNINPSWMDTRDLLGHMNTLDGRYYPAESGLFHHLVYAQAEYDSRGSATGLYLACLDEMNLSHVERYFADFLSSMESEEGIHLYEGPVRQAGDLKIPNRVKLPPNLFVIGTVNVDETTYMFSPKVLDRANVIEFRMDEVEMAAFLKSSAKPDLMKLAGKGVRFGRAFLDGAKDRKIVVPASARANFEDEMNQLFTLLARHHGEFGYRTAHEAGRFIHFYKELGGFAEDDASWFPKAMDCVIAQKLLPKLHGSRTKLGPLLKDLWCATTDAPGNRNFLSGHEPKAERLKDAYYPISAEKIFRMWKLLGENGFASFAEA
jgi:5-methylcytosine-specific restriction protein B